MTSFAPLQNLKSFVLSVPPLIIFTLSLAILAITSFSLAYYISEKVNLIDPKLHDWNYILNNIVSEEFCIVQERTLKNLSQKSIQSMENATQMAFNPKSSISVSTRLVFKFLAPLDLDISYIAGRTFIPEVSADHTSNINFIINGNFTFSNSTQGMVSFEKEVCLTVFSSESFPSDTDVPLICNSSNHANQKIGKSAVNLVGASLTLLKDYGSTLCNNKTRIVIEFLPSINLNGLMSLHDRSIMNLHLMHTSYFLFVMVVTVFCCGLLKGKGKLFCDDKGNLEKV